jgi:hypothetical protein
MLRGEDRAARLLAGYRLPQPTAKQVPNGDEKPARSLAAQRTSGRTKQRRVHKTERTGNVYENKGALWKNWERTGNIVENKGSYVSISGILLKVKSLSLNGAGDRCQKMKGRQQAKATRAQGSSNDERIKLNERTGNFYENKGPLWKTWERTGNVVENKGTYGPAAGILLKTQDLSLS